MSPDLPGAPADPVLTGILHLNEDAFRDGWITNPTKSLLMGDKFWTVMYGCLIEVEGADELRNGFTGPAVFRFWQPYIPPLPGPPPLSPGHVRGWASDLRLYDVDDDDVSNDPGPQ